MRTLFAELAAIFKVAPLLYLVPGGKPLSDAGQSVSGSYPGFAVADTNVGLMAWLQGALESLRIGCCRGRICC